MSNPTVTRLGKTQMWYKLWSTPVNYSRTLKITHSFENFVNLYFNYGLMYSNNFFQSNYWYRTNTNNTSQLKSLYFRKYFFLHKVLAIEHSYHIRLNTPEYFQLRTFLMKYNQWVIFSIQWFKPWKNSNSNFSKKHNNSGILKPQLPVILPKGKKKYKPIKRLYITSFLIKNLHNKVAISTPYFF